MNNISTNMNYCFNSFISMFILLSDSNHHYDFFKVHSYRIWSIQIEWSSLKYWNAKIWPRPVQWNWMLFLIFLSSGHRWNTVCWNRIFQHRIECLYQVIKCQNGKCWNRPLLGHLRPFLNYKVINPSFFCTHVSNKWYKVHSENVSIHINY